MKKVKMKLRTKSEINLSVIKSHDFEPVSLSFKSSLSLNELFEGKAEPAWTRYKQQDNVYCFADFAYYLMISFP